VPEGIDNWRLDVVARSSSWIADVFVTKGDSETANGQARDARDDGESYSLLHGEDLGHEDEFTFAVTDSGFGRMSSEPSSSYSQI